MSVRSFAPGNYRYIPAVFQYSSGVAAEPGFRVERVRFRERVPLARGFETIAAHIKATGRPLTAFCACELRSPKPFTDSGFKGFNEHYVQTLAAWGIYRDGDNPVARSNVCPELDPPAEPSFHAFAYTVADPSAAPSFHIAGSGEARQGTGSYAERIVRLNDTSRDGLLEKAQFVTKEMERRMGLLGFDWRAATATQVYCVHDVAPAMTEVLAARGAAREGIVWHYARPPVIGLDYEMDCRGVSVERVIAAP